MYKKNFKDLQTEKRKRICFCLRVP